MPFDDRFSEIDEEDISEDTKTKKLQKLHEFIKAHSHLHEEYYSVTIGSDE